MNLGDLRLAVRTQLDLDETDLPNTLLDLYFQEGFDRLMSMENRWPFYETTWNVATNTEGVATLPLEALEIDAVIGTEGPLSPIAQRYADDYFLNDPVVSGLRPLFFTRTATTIMLWPQQTTPMVLLLRGFRRPGNWIAGGAGSEVDSDPRMHYPLVHYACSLAMAQQEDEVLEQTYLTRFKESAAIAHEAVMRPWSTEPLILNGARRAIRAEPRLILELPDTVEEFDGTIEGGTP